MPDMAESSSEIELRARELVLYELSGMPSGHVHHARYILSPRTDAVQIEVHKRAAELHRELIAAATEVWDRRDQQVLADAEKTAKENRHA